MTLYANPMDDRVSRKALIACGVFRPEIEALVASGKLDGIDKEHIIFLEGGLHSKPNHLREVLQERIDRLEDEGSCTGIALLYGVCGRGLVGLKSRSLPLFIPRVHDCIALFLGSDARYRREFEKTPGTFYITPGWYEEGLTPFGKRGKPVSLDPSLSESFEGYRDRYGEKNAEAIFRFYNSWQKNYQRSVFIDTGIESEGKSKRAGGGGDSEIYREYARDFASEFDWDYQELQGSSRLIEKLAAPEKNDSEILMVPPGRVTIYDTRSKGLGVGAVSPGKERVSDTPAPASEHREAELPNIRYGLGIDAGGTYTDAVIYDLQSKELIQSGKGRTTPENYTTGIAEAVGAMDPALLRQVGMVAISTTLATNAIVEGKGRDVGLIMMHSGIFDPEKIENRPFALVSGRIDINGKELIPVDPKEVGRIAREMVAKHHVEAFAVSGYAGSVNPSQELQVKEILEEKTGLHVCCGHELSDLYNIYHRANTAVLNGRIIPLLEAFLEDVISFLRSIEVDVPVLVVRGDGTLMSIDRAREVPVETSLSGPAASVSGARFLTGLEDATIVDVGGTTSDIGKISGGRVELQDKGSRVGRWRTHVRALDMSTLGIGGDSMIELEKGELQVGPKRILPFCRLAADFGYQADISALTAELDRYDKSSEILSWYYLRPEGRKGHSFKAKYDLTDRDVKILERLKRGPLSRIELARELGYSHWMMLDLSHLEKQGFIRRSGLTPTDLLHADGRLELWDTSAAKALQSIFANLAKGSGEDFSSRVFDLISRRLLQEIILKQLPDGDKIDRQNPPSLLSYLVTDELESLTLQAHFPHPLIGLGAPVSFFLEGMEERAGLEVIVPPHAEVANAIGAVTSTISVSAAASIIPVDDGGFGVRGVDVVMDFEEFEDADRYAREVLKKEVLHLARDAGTASETVFFEVDDSITKAADGSELFLERHLTARVTGAPDLSPVTGKEALYVRN